jgi:hypothetical protein
MGTNELHPHFVVVKQLCGGSWSCACCEVQITCPFTFSKTKVAW